MIPCPVLQYNSSKVKGALRCQLWACGPMCIKAFFNKILNFHVSLVPAYLMHLNLSHLEKKKSLAFQYQDEMTTQGANSGEKIHGAHYSQVSIDNTFLLSLLIFALCIAILHGFHVTICIRIYQKNSCFTIFNGLKKICPAIGEIRLLINGSDGCLQGSVWLHRFTWISFTSLCGFCYHSKWNAQRHKPSVHSFGI